MERFQLLSRDVRLDASGYVAALEDNLLEGVALSSFEADLRQGGGNELKKKFRAVHSSAALAANTFAPFKTSSHALNLAGIGAFDTVRLEGKCPHGVSKSAPNLDALAEGSEGVVAIESKLLEPLSPHTAMFSPKYKEKIVDDRRRSGWFAEMLRLETEPKAYRWLDAAQLIKHAFGIARTYPDRTARLLYLFWEPANPETHPIFAEHRAEIARFAKAISGGGPEFAAISYPELWREWAADRGTDDWLAVHVARLRARYEVAIAMD